MRHEPLGGKFHQKLLKFGRHVCIAQKLLNDINDERWRNMNTVMTSKAKPKRSNKKGKRLQFEQNKVGSNLTVMRL